MEGPLGLTDPGGDKIPEGERTGRFGEISLHEE